MRRFISCLLVIAVLIPMLGIFTASASAEPEIWDGTVASGFASGSGTKEDPYIIMNGAQLAYLSKTVNAGNSYDGQYLKLGADIWLNDTVSPNWTENANRWEAIGYWCISWTDGPQEPFQGTLDGDYHTVEGIFLSEEYIGDGDGLFGYVGWNGTVENLGILKSDFSNGWSWTGAVAGYCEGTIRNCYNKSDVIVDDRADCIGGIVGGTFYYETDQNSCIERCYNTGNISGAHNVGGIAGKGNRVYNSYNSGNVSGEYLVGGICGDIWLPQIDEIKFCYNVGTVKAEEDRAGAILGSSKWGILPNSCYYLAGCASDGSGVVQNGIGTEGIGQTLADETYRTVGLPKEKLTEMNTFKGFDFLDCWHTGDILYPYPVLNIEKKSYAETYGWCITNSYYSYANDKSYRVPAHRYYDTFGISLASLADATLNKLVWSGNCYGLSVLSMAEYFNKVDLSDDFSKSGDDLYSFGYEKIGKLNTGEEYFTLVGNQKAIASVERAMISQDSVEMGAYEVFRDDPHYTGLIDLFSSKQAKPILVCFRAGFGHAMVITPDRKPTAINDEKYEGWLAFSVYDPNAPIYSDMLEKPTEDYRNRRSYFFVNPETTEWVYWVKGREWCRNTYIGMEFPTFHTVQFYDLEQMDPEIFTKPLDLWHKRIHLQIHGSNVTVKDKNGNVQLAIEDGQVTQQAEQNRGKVRYDSEENGTIAYTFWTDETYLTISSTDAAVVAAGEDSLMAVSLDGTYTVAMDLENGTIRTDSQRTQGEFVVCVQDYQGRAVRLKGENVAGQYAEVALTNGKATITGTQENVTYDLEKLQSQDVQAGKGAVLGMIVEDDTQQSEDMTLWLIIGGGILVVLLLVVVILVIAKKKRKG